MYLPRTLEKSVLTSSDSFPVLLVTGPRQVGKTTIFQVWGAKESQPVARCWLTHF